MKKFLGLIVIVLGITTLSSCYMSYDTGYRSGPRGPRPGYHRPHHPPRVGPGYHHKGPGYHKAPSKGHYNRGANYGPRR